MEIYICSTFNYELKYFLFTNGDGYVGPIYKSEIRNHTV